jgi:hypothetical protein
MAAELFALAIQTMVLFLINASHKIMAGWFIVI